MPTGPKRYELHIEHRNEVLSFRLFELETEAGEVELAAGERPITLQVLASEGKEWRESLSTLESEFNTEYLEAYKRSRELAEANGKTGSDIQDYILSDDRWANAVQKAANKLVTKTGKYVEYFSAKLLNTFLPLDSQFWGTFNELIEYPTREAFSETETENPWLKVPLLQLRVAETVLLIPWWITRTQDLNSLWCTRYALAVSPSLRRTKAPNIDFSAKNPLHILTVTRPTSDLQQWMPIDPEIAQIYSKDARLVWRMVDGFLGVDDQPRPDRFESDNVSAEFEGVDINLLKDSLKQEKRPNLVFYQGHWKNRLNTETQVSRPFIYLHDPKPTSSADPQVPSAPTLPVPLLDTIEPKVYAESVLIMNACNSAAPLERATYIQDFIDQHSVFIGANYPLVAHGEGTSIGPLLTNLIDNKHLAHTLLQANQLEKPAHQKHFNPRHLYFKAALCLFGDVRAHLFLKWNTTTQDNVTPIQLVLTNRWKEGFEKLQLKHSKGLTFRMDIPANYAPTDKFAMTDKGVQIAITPLATAIDLCNSDAGHYRILGPAFTSRQSVAIVSRKIHSLQKLAESLEKAWIDGVPLRVGILATRLTSTFMLKGVILEDAFPDRQPQWLTLSNWPKLITYHPAFSQGNSVDVLKDEFLDSVDLTLILHEDPEKVVEKKLFVISEDLETKTATRLGLKTKRLPRGIFITKRENLVNEADASAVEEFCNLYNDRVLSFEESAEEYPFNVESTHDIPLYTFGRANRHDLQAIKAFAETSFFAHEPFDWNNFAYVPVITSDKALTVVSELGKCLDDLKRRAMSDEDALKIGQEIMACERTLQLNVSRSEWWTRRDLIKLVNDELSKLKESTRNGLSDKLFLKLNSEDLVELRKNV
jgi:hypothetical protein